MTEDAREEVTSKDLMNIMERVLNKVEVIEGTYNLILKEFNSCRLENAELKRQNEYLNCKVNRLEKQLKYLLNKENAKNVILFNIEITENQKTNLTETTVTI